MKRMTVDVDERTVAVANASYRWGYLFLSFAVLAVVAYRSFRFGQQSWDLIAIVLAAGALTAGYQQAQRIISVRTARTAMLVFAVGVAVAAAVAWQANR